MRYVRALTLVPLALLMMVQAPAAYAVTLADDYGTGVSTTLTKYYCPKLVSTFSRGARDSTSGGQVSELQEFLADYFSMDPETLVSGYFGGTTHTTVVRLQTELQLPALGIVGSLTRTAIAQVCAGAGDEAVKNTTTATSASAASITSGNLVDLKFNGSDGPIAVSRLEAVTVSWVAPQDWTCLMQGMFATPTSTSALLTNLPPTGVRTLYAYIPSNNDPVNVRLSCSKNMSQPMTNDAVYVTLKGYTPPEVTTPRITSFVVTPYPMVVGGTMNATWQSINASSCVLYAAKNTEEGTAYRALLASGLPASGSRQVTHAEVLQVTANPNWHPVVLTIECTKVGMNPDSTAFYTLVSSTTQTNTAAPYAQATYYTQSAYSSYAQATYYSQASYGGTTGTYSQGSYNTAPTYAEATYYSQATYAPAGAASATLKINGSDGPVSLADGDPISVTWNSTETTSCAVHGVKESTAAVYAYVTNLASSGARNWYAYVPSYTPFAIQLRCTKAAGGTIDDSVSINKVTNNAYSQASYYSQSAYDVPEQDGGGALRTSPAAHLASVAVLSQTLAEIEQVLLKLLSLVTH